MHSGLTLGEQVVLLALEGDSGTLREPMRAQFAVAAAPLLELTLSGHVVVRDGKLVAAPLAPPAEPVAAAMAEQVQSRPDASPQAWLLAVREQAVSAAYAGLQGKGLVREEGRRVLGVFGSHRYPVEDPAVPEALRRELAAVVLEGQKPGKQTAALIALLHHAGLHAVALPDADTTAVQARMADIAEGQGPADKLGEAVRSALRALIVLTAASVPGMFN